MPSFKKQAMHKGVLTQGFDNTSDETPGQYNSTIGKIPGMQSMTGEALDKPGWQADGQQIYKFGTPYGESAQFNYLPPGMDISNQANALINNMPLRVYSGGVTYPMDTPWPVRDVPE